MEKKPLSPDSLDFRVREYVSVQPLTINEIQEIFNCQRDQARHVIDRLRGRGEVVASRPGGQRGQGQAIRYATNAELFDRPAPVRQVKRVPISVFDLADQIRKGVHVQL